MSKLTKVRHIMPRGVKIKLIFLLLGIIAGAQIETLTLSLIQPFIWILTDPGVVYTNNLLNFAYRLFGFTGISGFMALLAIVIAIAYAVRGLYFYFFERIRNLFIARNTVHFSNQVLAKTLQQSYQYHANNNIAQLQRVVIGNVNRMFGLINATMSLLVDGFMSLFILIFLLFSSLSMTLTILFLAGICIFIYFRIYRGKVKASGEDEARGNVMVNKSLLQSLNGVKEIKVTGSEKYFTSRFVNISSSTIKNRARMQSMRQLPKLFIESLCFSGAFIVVAIAIIYGVDMESLVPQLGLFVVAGFKLLPAISRLVTNITQIIRLSRSIDQVYDAMFQLDTEFGEVLPEPEEVIDSEDIAIEGLTFKYPKSKKPVLQDLSLTIPKNKSVAFIGESGSGKSTLVDIILGVLAPSQGYVAYDGKSIHHNFSAWIKKVGYIPQTIYLLDETILENVAFGIEKDKIDEEKVWQALEQAQLKDYVQSLPEGLHTGVGDRGVRISGGQRQRIGIARALYHNPDILVMDEATSALDNKTEKAVMEAIQSLKGNKTFIIVAHRLSTIKHCDIVYKVAKGKVKLVRGEV